MIQSGKYIPSPLFITSHSVNYAAAECLFKLAENHESATPASVAAICFDTTLPIDDYSARTYAEVNELARNKRLAIETPLDENLDEQHNPFPNDISPTNIITWEKLPEPINIVTQEREMAWRRENIVPYFNDTSAETEDPTVRRAVTLDADEYSNGNLQNNRRNVNNCYNDIFLEPCQFLLFTTSFG